MKAVLLILVVLSVSIAKETKVGVTTSTQTTLKTHSQGDMIGEAYNSDDKQDVVAVTYGIASDGGNNLPDVTGYRLP